MLQLILNPNMLEEKVFPLGPEPLTIGRSEENSVCYLHKSLSRQHARVELVDGRVLLTDLGSKNGTFVHGQRITQHELRPGEQFTCGEIPFQLASADLQPTMVQELNTQLLGSLDELLGVAPDQQETSLNTTAGALRFRDETDPSVRTQRKLQILLQFGQVMSSPNTLDVLLEKILDLVFQLLELDHAAILLMDGTTGELLPRVTRTSDGATGEFTYSRKIVDYVQQRCVAVLFDDMQFDSGVSRSDSIMRESIRASICVPLKPKEQLIGVLYLDNRSKSHRFTAEELEFLTAFAGQAAVAIENANLYRRLEEEAVLRSHYLRFFPPTTLRKLQLSKDSPLELVETEVTALFADISNFTAISSTLEPREVVDMLNEYFPVMADIIFRYEGTLEKYIGDAMMAVWGAPFTHPDDVERAVQAAVEMQQALIGLNARWKAAGKREIQIHIGLNTGRVAAGNIGSERYLQYATIGDTTNVASRICNVAKEGEIVLAEATCSRLRERRWPLTPLPPAQVKGKDGPLSLHRLEWNRG